MTLLRFWLLRFGDAIRIAWTRDGIEHSAELSASARVTHSSCGVPECLRLAARDCLDAGVEHSIPGCEFMGFESRDEMFRQVAARCVECGVVQPSEDWLSRCGRCGACWTGVMARELGAA